VDHLAVKDTLEEKEYMDKEENLDYQDSVLVLRYIQMYNFPYTVRPHFI